MVLKWTKMTSSVFECSLRKMTKNIVHVTGAGTASLLHVSVTVTCASDSYVAIAAYTELNWMVVARKVVMRCGIS